jgi:adenylosuccinate lyase
MSLALLTSGYERLAVELRHLQRSEVAEVIEGFTPGQKGSSAMPHKKNPISAENITGCARLLRSYQVASMENIALWHERDISHSSVERLVFPDAFILADYITVRMSVLLDGLQVLAPQMLENIERSRGQLFSSQVLLALVNKGLDRELAYYHVQRVCHDLKPKEHLKTKILKDEELKKLLSAKELEKIFQGASLVKQSERLCQSVLRLGADSHKERMKHG